MTNRFVVTAVLLLTVLCFTTCSLSATKIVCAGMEVSESEAKRIAWDRLRQFVVEKGLKLERFHEPTMVNQSELPWTIDFHDKVKDQSGYHFFRVTIDSCGRVEKSWQYYP